MKIYYAYCSPRINYTRLGEADRSSEKVEELIVKVLNDLEHAEEFVGSIYASFSEAQWYPCTDWHLWTNQEEQAAIEEKLRGFCARKDIEYKTVSIKWPLGPE